MRHRRTSEGHLETEWSTRMDRVESDQVLTLVIALSSQLAGPHYTGQSGTTTYPSLPTS